MSRRTHLRDQTRGKAGSTSTAARLRRLLGPAAALALLLPTSACVQNGISQKSNEVHGLFYVILWLALPVFLFVEGMLLLSVVRYRRRRGDESEPRQYAGNNAALGAFFAGPLAIIVVLLAFGETTVAKVDHSERAEERLVINAFQWEWSANYVNEEITVTGKTLKQPMTMELPVGTPTRIDLRSTDVIHEFYVPHLLFMKNAVPGHPNVFTITPTKVGTYPGQCAQFCGLWHSRMTFVLKVVPPAEFRAWIERQKQAATSAGVCKPSGTSIALVARQVSWDKSCLAVPADEHFQITINNQDVGIAHNFAIWDSPKLKHRLFITPDLTGPGTKTYTGPELPPGKYYFQCDVHGPAMSGTLIVGG